MAETVHIKVFEVIGSSICVASDDGNTLFEQIASALKEGRSVELSFEHVANLTSAFLNAAIGQLYGPFKESEIRERMSVTDLAQDDLALLRRVVDTAKAYFQNPTRQEQIRRDIERDNE